MFDYFRIMFDHEDNIIDDGAIDANLIEQNQVKPYFEDFFHDNNLVEGVFKQDLYDNDLVNIELITQQPFIQHTSLIEGNICEATYNAAIPFNELDSNYSFEHGNDNISFLGFSHVERLADIQAGPTCGFEALENIIQLNNPNILNSLSDELQYHEYYDGGLVSSGALNTSHYQHILNSHNIPSHWNNFSHENIINAIEHDHGVLAIGKAHSLNPMVYPDLEGNHAFVITDVIRDDFGQITHYKGIDSNFENQETIWPVENIEDALTKIDSRPQLLITDRPLNWNNYNV